MAEVCSLNYWHLHDRPWLTAFLGSSPRWFKVLVIICLLGDIALSATLRCVVPGAAGFVVGWVMLAQFIGFLAMALTCYPLLPGGLLALTAVALGLTTPDHAYAEAQHNFPVILLLIFVVAGVSFLKEWLSLVFIGILFCTRSKVLLALLFTMAGALLSAFLDALTVTAVIIAVCKGFFDIYMDQRAQAHGHDEIEIEQFRAFLRSLVMHAVVGTALGGVLTVVGEPQNLLIAHVMRERLPASMAAQWDFLGFALRMAVVTVPTLLAGLATTAFCERLHICGYGGELPNAIRELLAKQAAAERAGRTPLMRFKLWVQALSAALMAIGLATHVAEVGMLGLALIVVATAFTGVNDEPRIGHAFSEAMPFTALLVVCFAIVAVIADQHLFSPVVRFALNSSSSAQVMIYFAANAILSMVSDNVFVATVFINEASQSYADGRLSPAQFEHMAIATNCGTNIPSIATPNGQAALLFLLTSALAGPIRLGYMRMMWMALPYAIVLSVVSALATATFVA